MIQETVRKLERVIEAMQSVDSAKKTELLALLDSLKSEVGKLSETRVEHAHSIAGLTEMAAHEALRKEKSPRLLKHSLDGLSLSVQELEVTHPKLVAAINRLCEMLAGIGI